MRQKPFLLLGYDSEKYGIFEDENKNIEDRKEEIRGIDAILKVHKHYNVPLTIFILGKLLTLSHTKEYYSEISKLYKPNFLDLQQHTYSHILVKHHRQRGNAPSIDIIQEEINKTNGLIKTILDRKCSGIRTPLGYFNGLQGEKELLGILHKEGIKFISSDLTDKNDGFPSPLKNEKGNYREPYFYNEDGFFKILEIPTQGNSDNILKGIARGYDGIDDYHPEKELKYYLGIFEELAEKNKVFAPCFHCWTIANKDPDGLVIDGLINYAYENGIEILNYIQYYEYMIALSSNK